MSVKSPGAGALATMPIPARLQQQLFVLRNANMQLTTDQTFTKLFAGTNYVTTAIVAKRVSGAASVACLGGIYDAAAKGGNALVAVGQSWVTLASGIIVTATLAALNATTLLSATPILSLSTGSTAACVADLFIFGVILD